MTFDLLSESLGLIGLQVVWRWPLTLPFPLWLCVNQRTCIYICWVPQSRVELIFPIMLHVRSVSGSVPGSLWQKEAIVVPVPPAEPRPLLSSRVGIRCQLGLGSGPGLLLPRLLGSWPWIRTAQIIRISVYSWSRKLAGLMDPIRAQLCVFWHANVKNVCELTELKTKHLAAN